MPTASLVLGALLAATAVARFQPQWATFAYALAVVPSLLYWLLRIFVYPFYFSPLRHLPEPKGATFPWMHAEDIRNSSNGEPFRRWINSVPNNGLIRFRVLLNQEWLMLTSPQALREVLVTRPYDFIKPSEPTYVFRALLGHGLLSAEGEEHKVQRKAIMPAFSYRHIKDLYPTFWAKARQSVEAISAAQEYDEGTEIPKTQSVREWAHRTTLDIIGLAGTGHDFNSLGDPHGEAVSAYHELTSDEGPLFFWTSIGLEIPMRYVLSLPSRQFRTIRRASARLTQMSFRLLAEKQDKLRRGNDNDIDIASVALASGSFDGKGLVDQMMTFLAAGHDTTASAMTWATYLLSKHPDVQTRLRAEIREHLPALSDPTKTIDATQIDALPFLNAVYNEVFRFMPPVPVTMRDAACDTTICGQRVPKGTRVFICPWAVNVSRDLWGPDALDFKPERWLKEGQANTGGAQSNFANLTYIHGSRSCIGKDFAKAEFMCLLAAWIGRFEVGFAHGVELPPDIEGWVTAKAKHGMPLVFKEVDGW